MIKETVVARDMNIGMKMIKETYGEDALILDSRVRRSRRPGSLELIEEVEIDIAMGVTPEKLVQGDQVEAGGRQTLPTEIKRLEEIVVEMELQLEQEQEVGESEVIPYPPAERLLDLGVDEGTVRQLARDHEEEVPRVDLESFELAVKRLGDGISCVEDMKLRDLRGFHALMGGPGAGKTALALRLAELVASGGNCQVVVLSYDPAHPGEAVRLEQRAEQGGFEAALAPDREALLGAMRYLADRDLVILDMSPHQESDWSLLTDLEQVLDGEPILKHLVVPADGAWRGLDEKMGNCDFLALTRTDLGEPLIPALDLARGENALSVTFMLAGACSDAGIALASSARLVTGIRDKGHLLERAAGGGGR
jgi:flagellar biosynthesis GTPase FlhF